MAAATADSTIALEPNETFADITVRLGDIPPSRIIWLPRPATEGDVVRCCEEKRLAELFADLEPPATPNN